MSSTKTKSPSPVKSTVTKALVVESSQQEDDASPTPAVPLIAIQQPTPIIRSSKRKATPDKSTANKVSFDVAEEEEEEEISPAKPAKRGRGRGKTVKAVSKQKPGVSANVVSEEIAAETPETATKTAKETAQKKGKRGRKVAPAQAEEENISDAVAEPPPKRGRGRGKQALPPETLSESAVQETIQNVPVKKGRGRTKTHIVKETPVETETSDNTEEAINETNDEPLEANEKPSKAATGRSGRNARRGKNDLDIPESPAGRVTRSRSRSPSPSEESPNLEPKARKSRRSRTPEVDPEELASTPPQKKITKGKKVQSKKGSKSEQKPTESEEKIDSSPSNDNVNETKSEKTLENNVTLQSDASDETSSIGSRRGRPKKAQAPTSTPNEQIVEEPVEEAPKRGRRTKKASGEQPTASSKEENVESATMLDVENNNRRNRRASPATSDVCDVTSSRRTRKASPATSDVSDVSTSSARGRRGRQRESLAKTTADVSRSRSPAQKRARKKPDEAQVSSLETEDSHTSHKSKAEEKSEELKVPTRRSNRRSTTPEPPNKEIGKGKTTSKRGKQSQKSAKAAEATTSKESDPENATESSLESNENITNSKTKKRGRKPAIKQPSDIKEEPETPTSPAISPPQKIKSKLGVAKASTKPDKIKTEPAEELNDPESVKPAAAGKGRGRRAGGASTKATESSELDDFEPTPRLSPPVIAKRSGRGAAKSVVDREPETQTLSSQSTASQQSRSGKRTMQSSNSSSSQDASEPVPKKGRGAAAAASKAPALPEPATPVRSRGRPSAAASTPKASANNGATCDPVPGTPGTPTLRQRSMLKPKVMFTGVVDESGEKIIKSLGGEIAESIEECTHLVTDKVRRTMKFLCGVARGILIVQPAWLEKCKHARMFIDATPFIVSDKPAEKNFQFSLQRSLETAQAQGGMLAGYRVHVTKGVKPEPSAMKDIITCAGGHYLATMPKKAATNDQAVVVISCEEDAILCGPPINAGIPVVSAEFILTGTLRQQADTKLHALKIKAPAGSKRKK